MSGVERVEVVLANGDRATLRVGDVFLKVDGDRARADAEVAAMAAAPVPTPDVLWHRPPVLALAALRGTALRVADASAAAWAAVGAAVRRLHEAPLPARRGPALDVLAARLERESEWLVANGVLPAGVVEPNRRIAEGALRPWTPAFVHGDLHDEHVFVDGDEVTGIIDWSEAAQGDPLYDLATLTLAHQERVDDVLRGYGGEVDRDAVRAWTSFRCLVVVRWLSQHGYGPPDTYPEVALLRSRASED